MVQYTDQQRKRLKYFVVGFVVFICFIVYGVMDDQGHVAQQEAIRGAIANHYIVQTQLLGRPTAETAKIFGTLIDVEEAVPFVGEKNCWLVKARMNLDSKEWSYPYAGDIVKLTTAATLMPKLLTPMIFLVCKDDSGAFQSRFPPEVKRKR
jgi:hypothetical protein